MSRSSRDGSVSSAGFTLIELLVVITVIGMLMAMLLPATSAVKAQVQRMQCSKNQVNVALAIKNYTTQSPSHRFPGFIQPTILDAVDPKKNYNGSWVVQILPHLDQAQLYQRWRDVKNFPTTNAYPRTQYLEVLVCPSNPAENLSSAALNFVVNTGTLDNTSTSNTMPPEKAGDGLFFNRMSETSTNPVVGIISTTDAIRDGEGSTLMVSENVNTNTSTGLTTWGGDDTTKPNALPVPVEADFGFVWWDKDDPPERYRSINHGKTNSTTGAKPLAGEQVRPSSTHTNGVNVVYVDCNARFLRDDIDYWVYQQLCTPDGANASVIAKNASGNPYLLDAKDYN